MRQTSRITAIRTGRDLLLFSLNSQRILVVSCDSAGGIGPKPLDGMKVSAETLGKFTARVALMEALSVGATPICLTTTLSVEREPTGIGIIKGIESELRFARLIGRVPVLDSTEKNFDVRQTGVGVTAIGTTLLRSLRIGLCKRGDAIIAIGTPCIGIDVLVGMREGRIADTRNVQALLKKSFVHEIIPVGSQGIMKEADTIARDSRLQFQPDENVNIDLTKSAGPSTVLLCSAAESRTRELIRSIRKPTAVIGFLT